MTDEERARFLETLATSRDVRLDDIATLEEIASRLRARSEDTERLDWLADKYPRQHGWVCRDSTRGRGWRLHQTKQEGAFFDVRAAIDSARKRGE